MSLTRITENKCGLRCESISAGSQVALDQNAFAGNSSYGVDSATSVCIDASRSWWGSPDGPGPLGSGDVVRTPRTTVLVDPWLEDDPTTALPPPFLGAPAIVGPPRIAS